MFAQIRDRVKKGIPDSVRGYMWTLFAEDDSKKKELVDLYLTNKTKRSSHEKQIDLDVHRTMRTHVLFANRYGHGFVSLWIYFGHPPADNTTSSVFSKLILCTMTRSDTVKECQ